MFQKTGTPIATMNHCKIVVWLLSVLFTGFAVTAVAEQRYHDSHVHGIGKLNIALDGKDLIIELDSPAANIVGFEHAPENDAQKQTVHSKREQLKKGDALFVFPAAAKCILKEVHIDDAMGDAHEDHADHNEHEAHEEQEGHGEHGGHDHHDREQGSGHSDFEIMYHFTCSASEKIETLDVRLFEYFQVLEKIDVQLITPDTQTAVQLTPENHIISL